MRLLPQFVGSRPLCSVPCGEDDQAVVGLQASLRSSSSLRAILECAKERRVGHDIDAERMRMIERICQRYEQHQQEVRDHCLDYFSAEPALRRSNLRERTGELISSGKTLFAELREAILTF